MMRYRVTCFGVLSAALLTGLPAYGLSFTLSDAGLMDLDDNPTSADTASIVARRDVPGPGVEFDIHYIGNDGVDDSIWWLSHDTGGAGTLVGIDIAQYDLFELEFTLVNVSSTPPHETGGILNVGARINGARDPLLIDLDPQSSHPASGVSASPVLDGDMTIRNVGFLAWEWLPEQWSPDGSTVTLLVAPVPGAVAIPEPATCFVTMCAAAAWTLCRRRRPARP